MKIKKKVHFADSFIGEINMKFPKQQQLPPLKCDNSYNNNNEETPNILLTPTEEGVTMTDVEAFTNNGDHEEIYSEEAVMRIAVLEEKTRSQEVEIILLKSALSDVLTQLAALNSQQQAAAATMGSARTTTRKSVDSQKSISRSNSQQALKIGAKGSPAKPSTANKQRSSSVTSTPKASPPTANTTPSTTSRKTSRGNTSKTNQFRRTVSDASIKVDNKENTPNDGKPKLILAQKRAPLRRKSTSSNTSDDGKDTLDDTVKFYIRGRGIRLHRPTEFKDVNPDGRAPEETLKLDWVYGYRGKDCRDNLFQLPATGELVYNMAGVVVMYDIKTNKQRHYTEHNDDVKCIALHPNKVLVASGQVAGHGDDAKPHVRVWDSKTLETKSTFGHCVFERGLCAIEFSQANGNYLVCIDEGNDHVAYLYDWEKGLKLTESNVSKEVVFSIKWQPDCDNAFVTYGKSHLGFWKINNNDVASCQITKRLGIFDKVPKPKYVVAVLYSPDNELVVGDSDGNVLLFNEGSNKVNKSQCNVHKGGTFSLTYLEKQDQYLSGGKDNIFITWSRQLEKICQVGILSEQYGPPRSCLFDSSSERFFIGTSKNCIVQTNSDWSEESVVSQGHSDEMWGLATHPTKPIFVTCSFENLVCIWDGEKQMMIWSYFIEDGAQCAEIHSSEPLVLIGTKSGTIYLLNYESKEELVTLPVSRDCIDDVKVSPDGKYMAAACRDSHIYLYSWPKEVTNFKKPKTLQGHSSRVLHLDWSVDGEFLQSNSGDYEVLFWHAESGCQVLTPAALRDIEWFTYTCPFGFPVMGIWPEGADGTDINACSRSHDKLLVATGDDFGGVNLFKYPSVKLRSECQVGVGHSSHVTCVRFLSGDASLITVGGNDSSVMQWKLVKQ